MPTYQRNWAWIFYTSIDQIPAEWNTWFLKPKGGEPKHSDGVNALFFPATPVGFRFGLQLPFDLTGPTAVWLKLWVLSQSSHQGASISKRRTVRSPHEPPECQSAQCRVLPKWSIDLKSKHQGIRYSKIKWETLSSQKLMEITYTGILIYPPNHYLGRLSMGYGENPIRTLFCIIISRLNYVT